MFFADKGFKNEPKRCKACKAKRAEGGGHAAPARTETKTNCSQCGKETTVPFRPTQGRPVFAGNASSNGGPWARRRREVEVPDERSEKKGSQGRTFPVGRMGSSVPLLL